MEITISRLKEIIKEEIRGQKESNFVLTEGHDCANHVKENKTGRTGRCVSHNWNETLKEVTAYDVDDMSIQVNGIANQDLTWGATAKFYQMKI